MNREIKFKAWVKRIFDKDIKGIMVEVKEFYLKSGDIGYSCYCERYDRTVNLLAKKGNFELLQWTGLKDRNGTEIYEGDIIEGTNIVFDTKILEGQVIMSKGFWATVKRNKRELDKETDDFLTNIGQEEMKNYFFHVNLFAINKPEIIGNVFENPELLEGE